MSPSLLLTAEERARFAAWLEYEAETDEGMAAQAEKINAGVALVRRLRAESTAAKIIAKKLRETEDFTV